MKLKLILTITIILGFIASGNAFATRYDYSDATGYDIAKHSTPNWQKLGTVWNNENSPLNEDTSDDGVSWSVDGGSSYGHENILAGQEVTFKFDMYKYMWGRHQTDNLSVWIDWNQDSVFSDPEENVFQESWDFTIETGYEYGDGIADISKSFTLTMDIPDDTGDFWLRARVACSADSSFDPTSNIYFDPTGDIWQGEVEDWKFTVAAPVPEPSTIILLGSGLLGLGWYGRKRKKV